MTVLLLLFILISSVLAYYFFSPNPDEPNFVNLEKSFVNLFVLVTTANYPDVMMPAFTYSSYAPIFFVLFLILGLYTISNIFLAFVFDFYQVTEKRKYRSIFLHRRQAVRLAYDQALQADEGGINLAAYERIVRRYDPRIKQRDIVLSFNMLDRTIDGYVSKEEFYRFFEVCELRWRIDYIKTIGHEYTYAPTKGWSKWRLKIRELVSYRLFDHFINSVILANLIYVVVEAALHSGPETPVSKYQLLFSFFFLFEVIIKLIGFGSKAYFQDGWNMFDFVIVTVSVSLAVIELAANQSDIGIYITIARAFRLARIFRTHKTFKQIVEVIVYLYPKAARFFIALLCVYYFFATIGMAVFHDTVSQCDNDECPVGPCDNGTCDTRTCHLDNYLVRNTSIGGLNFQLMSFDNVLLAYNTLFMLMVVNNWQITMEAHVCATNQTASRVFFFVYYLLTVIVVSNVVVAFVLDAFQVLYDKRTSKDPDSSNYKLRVLEVSVPRSVAAEFLSEDNPALQSEIVHFRAVKKDTALYDLLYANDLKDWIREDQMSSGEVRVEMEDLFVPLDVLALE
ncbi:hypothetical protein PTSG_04342 [Salpingoeca rosetta]|uniref:Ion transport domain-containing protein n=1 Tax=Salpingoeca rosetta (strain ATCC 50818 / BSB-021) TaxID=946362 RepID=F2U899_SALR5|nr:uncharacterized protein PTSG_04342 [Salpingoeca rosetta]EGD72607.1 hypothetical protein PTSG_04342 [Salpingoeca rosetta]|eukprot:XP_004994430.1 hypothetical protein PTSG_04342 [Salpingoeca rosetta]